MSTAPRITAGVTAYKADRFLAEAIESILRQSLPACEIIVVIDGSPDQSAAVAHSFAARGVRTIEHAQNRGIGAARNTIIEAMQGNYLAVLDADDLWTQDHLERLWSSLVTSPGHLLAFGRVRQFLCPQIPEDRRQTLKCPEEEAVAYVAGGMLAAKSVYDSAGPYDEALKVGEFIDWFMRVQDAGFSHAICDDLVLMRRIHGENSSLVHRGTAQGYALALKRALDRRRAAGADAP
ncbi:MAG: glycosyltransferase family A protein [Blastomonas sp.]